MLESSRILPTFNKKLETNWRGSRKINAIKTRNYPNCKAACLPNPSPHQLVRHRFICLLRAYWEPTLPGRLRVRGNLFFRSLATREALKNPNHQLAVAREMEARFKGSSLGDRPAFLYLLGDIVYYNGEASEYYSQFYHPYENYPAPIVAIPGNHDGDPMLRGPNREPGGPLAASLAAFMSNFCASSSHKTPEAHDSSRAAMTEPNPYWTLETPFATIVGLYTNVPEGGFLFDDQKNWLVSELQKAPKDKALIVTMHHPIYSISISSALLGLGTSPVEQALDEAINAAGRDPDIVFAAHANNYMRFTRLHAGHQIPFIVAGAGGYFNLRRVPHLPDGTAVKAPASTSKPSVTLENYDDTDHGFMQVTVTKTALKGEYFAINTGGRGAAVSEAHSVLEDSFAIDLSQHRIVSSQRDLRDQH